MVEEIKRDLEEVRELLKREVSSEKHLFDSSRGNKLFLASCTLLSGKLGQYHFERLKPAAVAVELLNLAVKRHYYQLPVEKAGTQRIEADLALITGDYYYARAILLVLPSGGEVVEIGARAIARVAQGETDEINSPSSSAFQKFCDKITQRSALYSASFQVGSLLSGVSPPVAAELRKFGECLGALLLLDGERTSHSSWRTFASKNFFKEAQNILGKLPMGEGLNGLKEIFAVGCGHLFKEM